MLDFPGQFTGYLVISVCEWPRGLISLAVVHRNQIHNRRFNEEICSKVQ